MKKSKSMIILSSIVLLVGLIILIVVLNYNGFNIFKWLVSQQGLLVLFVSIIAVLFGIIIWVKMRDRL